LTAIFIAAAHISSLRTTGSNWAITEKKLVRIRAEVAGDRQKEANNQTKKRQNPQQTIPKSPIKMGSEMGSEKCAVGDRVIPDKLHPLAQGDKAAIAI
jgi:hypothetical protein